MRRITFFKKTLATVALGALLAVFSPAAAVAAERGRSAGDGRRAYSSGERHSYDRDRRYEHDRDYYRRHDRDRGYYRGGGYYGVYGGAYVSPYPAYDTSCGYYDAYGYWQPYAGCFAPPVY